MKFCLLNLCILFLVLSGCVQEHEKHPVAEPNTDTILQESSDTFYSFNEPEITSLPFPKEIDPEKFQEGSINLYTYSIGGGFNLYFDTAAKTHKKLYRLPVIKKLDYYPVDSALEYIKTSGDFYLNGKLMLTNYYRKLPDLGKLQCYYTCGFNLPGDSDLDKIHINSNKSGWYGFFILYDPQTFYAKVVEIFHYKYLGPRSSQRRFYIDENYNIQLAALSHKDENGLNLIDEGKVIKRYKIAISKDGNIKID
ncbi:MAG: hypothetical protein ACXWDO_08590 [Bacteroidia bacterium]